MRFQTRVWHWCLSCFGASITSDVKIRNYRFFEEAAELVQSTGMKKEEAIALVNYVYGRPAGDKKQEMGGVMVTLAALGNALDLDLKYCGELELVRCWEKIETIRAKQRNKHPDSPLPGLVP